MSNHNTNSSVNDGIGMLTHDGIISKISNSKVTVALQGNINCEGCKAKAVCGASEANAKEIEIFDINQSYKLNENVVVALQKQLGLKAVFWAYVFPFILLLSVLLVSSTMLPEWIAGLLALFILIPYYATLYFLKKSLRKAFKISILKNNQE